MLSNSQSDLVEHPLRLAIVHFTGRTNQFGLLRGLTNDEPGIDSDTVTTDAGTWLENVDARMAVGQPDELPNIDIQFVADNRQFVSKGDIYVTKTIFSQFAHFRGASIGNNTFAFHENLVEFDCEL
ncbi:hypothetical protein D9M70_632420 [compost metagenome]